MRFTLFALTLSLTAAAAEPDATTPDAKALTALLQPMMVKSLKSPALDTKHNWGHQKEVVTGLHLAREGPLKLRPVATKELKNDGHWVHFTLDVPDAAHKLFLEISEVTSPQPGTLRFKAALRSKDVHLVIQQQMWKHGVRLLSNETRATCTAAVHLECDVTTRLETKPGHWIPETVVTAKVNKADIYHQNLMVEHTLGVGGDAARLIGEATLKLIQTVKPSLEKDTIAKAEAAIVKAGQSKDVRLSLESLGKLKAK
jgi:hypothetical protein